MNKYQSGCYRFAHESLRNYCADDPKRFFKNVFSETADNYNLLIWNLVYSKACCYDGVKINEFKVLTTKIEKCPTVLIKMAEFVKSVKAHYVAIILTSSDYDSINEGGFQYYALDYGETVEGDSETILSEWHKNYHFDFAQTSVSNGNQFLKIVQERLIKHKIH